MSGLKFLYNLILKDAIKGSGKASGIMSIGPDIRKITMNKYAKYVDSAKRQNVDLNKLSEQEIKYMLEMNKPKGPTIGGHRVIDASSSEGQGITRDFFNMLDRQSGKNVIKTDFGKPFAEEVGSVDGTIKYLKTLEPMDAMKESNKVLKGDGRYKSLSKADREKIAADESVTDHIFERDIPIDPEDMADGGVAGLLGEPTYADDNHRVPYGKGKLVDVARRKFLQWLGVGAAGTAAAKTGLLGLLKGGGKKQVIKELTTVPINNIEGMPAWFKPLVNKVIKEGDDVTKKFAEVDRQIVHKTKLPDSKTDVIVTQDLTTGDVAVDIGMGKHGFKDGIHGQPVRLEYKAAEDIMVGPDMDDMHKVGVRDPHIKVKRRDEMTFDQKKHPNKAPEEFWVEEAEFTGGHPENVKFEDVSYEKFGGHGSNFDEVEKFATGKVKKTKTTESRVFGEKYLSEGDDFASGGRVPLRGGYLAQGAKSLGKKYKGSTLAAILENPKLLGAELGHDGIMELMNLLPGLFSTGGRVPMWLGGGLSTGKRTLSELLKYMSKGSSHGKTPSGMLKMMNPKQFNEMLDRPEGIPSIAKEMIEKYTKEIKIDRANMIEDLIGTGRKMKKVDDDLVNYKIKIIEDMVSKGVDRKTAKETAENLAEMVSQGAGKKATPKITDQGLLEMENIQKNLATKDRKLNASGGRVSLSAGGLAGMLGE